MRYLSELKERGWACVSGIATRAELLQLAQSIGRPLQSPTGEIVKQLTPTAKAGARNGTFSSTYAKGAFPLHTDTAFWPVPSRYVVLRAIGDLRRQTTVLTFEYLFRNCVADLRALAEHSVWLTRTPSQTFYCSMRFKNSGIAGWRYDGQCMYPASTSAVQVQEYVRSRLLSCRVEHINWTSDMGLVLCNWDVLHGRGPAPPAEDGRILERIYVE